MLLPFVHSSSRTSPRSFTVRRPGCSPCSSGPSVAPGWNSVLLGVTWCLIQWVEVSSQKSFEFSSNLSLSFVFAHEASVATPTRKFSGLMGMFFIPLSGYFLASAVMVLASTRSLTRGFGNACCSRATRPARSGRLSFDSHDSAPMLARSWEISGSVQKLYLCRFRHFWIGISNNFSAT